LLTLKMVELVSRRWEGYEGIVAEETHYDEIVETFKAQYVTLRRRNNRECVIFNEYFRLHVEVRKFEIKLRELEAEFPESDALEEYWAGSPSALVSASPKVYAQL